MAPFCPTVSAQKRSLAGDTKVGIGAWAPETIPCPRNQIPSSLSTALILRGRRQNGGFEVAVFELLRHQRLRNPQRSRGLAHTKPLLRQCGDRLSAHDMMGALGIPLELHRAFKSSNSLGGRDRIAVPARSLCGCKRFQELSFGLSTHVDRPAQCPQEWTVLSPRSDSEPIVMGAVFSCAAARRCAGPGGPSFCREAFGGSVAALPRSSLRVGVQIAARSAPPRFSTRGRWRSLISRRNSLLHRTKG
jgi:hypothetical protein